MALWLGRLRVCSCELGVEVVELHHGAGTHEDASWYRVKGGPLDGALVEVLVEETGGLPTDFPMAAAMIQGGPTAA